MRRGGIEGPVLALLLLLAVIIGLVAYVGRGHRHGSDELEWEENVSVRSEMTVSSEEFEETENPGNAENAETKQVETQRSKAMRDLEEHLTQLMDLKTIE